MNPAASRTETTFGAAVVTTGLGVVTLALFPFAVPILVLTVVALVPLLLPVILLAAAGAIVVLLWLGLRLFGRGIRHLGRPRGGDAPSRPAPVAVPAQETRVAG